MAVTPDKYPKISFATLFNYLHVVQKGTVTTNGTATIPLNAGLTNPFFRVFIYTPTDVTPIGGYFNTASDAYIEGSNLIIKVVSSGGSPPSQTFTYFIYGGNYA